MFSQQKESVESLLKESIKLGTDLPDALSDIIVGYSTNKKVIKKLPPPSDLVVDLNTSYLTEEKQEEEKKEEQKDEEQGDIEIYLPAVFDIKSPYCFFKQRFYSSYCNGAQLAGFLIGGVVTAYIGLPLLLLDVLIINSILLCAGCIDHNLEKVYATAGLFYILQTIGTIIGLIINIIPALFYTIYETNNRPSGEEIYKQLKKLEKALNEKEGVAEDIVNRIKNEYKESTSDYPGLLFPRDQNSKQLYDLLADEKLPVTTKAAAIASYMETKNGNAGKELFNIILDKLHQTSPLSTVSFSNYYLSEFDIGAMHLPF